MGRSPDVGAAGCTVTSNDCDTLPEVFVAVTVTDADPAATPLSDTTEPSTDTPRTVSSLDAAAYEATTPENPPDTSTTVATDPPC